MKPILQIFGVTVFLCILVISNGADALPVNKCAQLIKSNIGSEAILNRCDVCMKIKVERKRPGDSGAAPTMRDYTMPPGANQPLPFKGPGGTRIVAEFPCKG